MPYLIYSDKYVNRSSKEMQIGNFVLIKNNSKNWMDVLYIFNEFFKFLSNRDVSHGELNRWRICIIYFGNGNTWSKMALNNLVAYGLGYVGFTESID